MPDTGPVGIGGLRGRPGLYGLRAVQTGRVGRRAVRPAVTAGSSRSADLIEWMFERAPTLDVMKAVFQASLLAADELVGSAIRRTRLERGAWIDVGPGWLAGADALFSRLCEVVPWRAERRGVYGKRGGGPAPLPLFHRGQPPAHPGARRP